MTLQDFMNEVSRRVDTAGTAIGAADTRRVLAKAFGVLAALPGHEALSLVASGLKKHEPGKK